MAHQEETQHQVVKKMNPALTTLSERRLIIDSEDSKVNVPGYSLLRYDTESRNTGGVMLYIKNDIKYEIICIKRKNSS